MTAIRRFVSVGSRKSRFDVRQIDSKSVCDMCGKQGTGIFGLEAKPALDIFHAFVWSETGPSEAGFTRLANNSICSYLELCASKAVSPGRCSCGRYAIGGEKHSSIRLGAKEVFKHGWREVDSIRNEERSEFVAREEALNDIIVTMECLGNPVSKVGAKTRSGVDCGVNL